MRDFPFLNAGYPFLQAGFPFLNAGLFFLHAGFPFLHAGFPFLNSGFPFLNAGLPFLNAGSPLLETGLPSGGASQEHACPPGPSVPPRRREVNLSISKRLQSLAHRTCTRMWENREGVIHEDRYNNKPEAKLATQPLVESRKGKLEIRRSHKVSLSIPGDFKVSSAAPQVCRC